MVRFPTTRPQMGKGKAGKYQCVDYNRAMLHEAYNFCSLECKIRKFSWHNVVNVKDVEMQSYLINNEMVLFLTTRPHMGKGKASKYQYTYRNRALLHKAYTFCLLGGKVRKSSGHNVVNVKDVEEVQPYLVNNEMVLFLTTRPQMGKGKAGEYRCADCNRALLHEAYTFYSLGGKVRKSTWHNFVNVKDVEGVQSYLVNNEMVLFLATGPQMGKGKAGEYWCADCNRALLHEAYNFCLLECKVRKSSRHNFVKVKDMEEVQSYLINNEMVMFLTTRPQMGKGKAGRYWCADCNTTLLHEAYTFC